MFKYNRLKSSAFLFLIFIIQALVLSGEIYGQVNSDGESGPKVGLVLSGGGAKGLAHIGILKAMEEAGITPDFITGTSMGSIIGGLYAAGYSADEIKEVAINAEWDQLLTNKLLLNEVTYENKAYYGRYANELNISGTRFELPRGLIEGQKLSMLLSRLTSHVMDIDDFNDLPIPYACIAADIVKGEKVVLNKGSLARSMRASMAIPSVFTPVELNDRLLVDGGLLHNFPVQEVIDMGADYVIGVFVGTDLRTKEEMNSPVSVLTQSAFLLGSFDNEKQKKLVDLYIEPKMEGYSTQDFHNSRQIVEIGEKTGEQFLEKLISLNDSLSSVGRINKKHFKPVYKDTILISDVRVINNISLSDAFIKGRLGIVNKREISITELERKITHLHGTGYFTRILYELQKDTHGNIITINVSESPEGKLSSAVQYDLETDISLLLNLTYRNLLTEASRFIIEGEISRLPTLDINYLKYFGEKQKAALSAGYYLRISEVPEFENNAILGLFKYNYHKYYGSVHLPWNTSNIVNLTYSYETAGLKPEILGSDLRVFDVLKFKSHNIEFNLEHNTLDNWYFPKYGNRLGIDASYSIKSVLETNFILSDTLDPIYIKSESRGILTADISQHSVYTIGKNITVGTSNKIGFFFREPGDTLSVGTGFLNQTYIGGFRKLSPNAQPFWGAETLRYYAENVFHNELMIRYEIRRNLYLSIISQYFLPNPLSFLYSGIKNGEYNFGGKKHLFAVGGSIAYNSPLGPISFSIGKGNTGSNIQYNINIGFYFDKY
mgnify:CR=1 FL=1